MHICPQEIAAAAAAVPVIALAPYCARRAWGWICRCARAVRRRA